MRSSTSSGTASPMLLEALVDELLDAHLDTIELARATGLDGPWDRQLDYLRALVRAGHAAQARAAG